MTDVIVVGAGVAGLSCAWKLQQAGKEVLMLEEKDRPGGNVWTVREEGFAYECGPHSFMPSADALWNLAAEADFEDRVAQAASISQARYIWRDGKLNALPMSPGSFLTSRVMSLGGKLRLAMEPFIKGNPSETETAAEFFRRRLGEQATRWLITPFVSGIYAGDPEKLGARDAFNKMWKWERDAGSMIRGAKRYIKAKRVERGDRAKKKGLFSFEGGLGAFTSHLAGQLEGAVHLSEGPTGLQRENGDWTVTTEKGSYVAPQLVLAVPPKPAARLMEPISPRMGEIFERIVMSPVSVVHLAVAGEDAAAIPDGFGFLVPRGEGVRMLGCIFVSKLFGDRAPQGHELIACFLGGAYDPEAMSLDDEALVEAVRDDLEAVLGRRVEPKFLRVKRHPQAIPQLEVGHLDRIAKLRALGREVGGLTLAGNYLSGVGISDATQSGLDAAAVLLEGGERSDNPGGER